MVKYIEWGKAFIVYCSRGQEQNQRLKMKMNQVQARHQEERLDYISCQCREVSS